MPELLSLAGSAEGISAAVQSGADAVCVALRGGPAGSRYGIGGEEFGRAAEFCRVRGVRLYAEIVLAPFDDDFSAAVETARRAARHGADAVVVHDTGLIWALRQALPELPVHAGQGLSVHNLDGVLLTAAMGVRRVALSPMLPMEEVEAICRRAPVEIEVAVQGNVCPACGPCFLPAFSGEGTALRDVCPELCRGFFPVEAARKNAPFQKDELCLMGRLRELAAMGVAALRVEGRLRRPEYTAAVTGVYAKLLDSGRPPDAGDYAVIRSASPARGFTDGVFGGHTQTFPGDPEPPPESFFTALRRGYLNHEFQRVRVRFTGTVARNEPVTLAVEDGEGHRAQAAGDQPELAFHHELDGVYLRTELSKTGGTPFLCGEVSFAVERGLFVSKQAIGALRDQALRELMELRKELPAWEERPVTLPPRAPNGSEPPVLTVSLQKCAQLSERLLELAPPVIYLPMEELLSGDERLEPFLRSEEVSLCAALPPFIRDGELPELASRLKGLWELGVREVLAGNLGHLVFLKKLGFQVRGGLGLNVRNSASLFTLKAFRLKSVALSPELTASRVRAVSKELPAELVVYGRMPLINTGECLIRDLLGACSCDGLTGIVGEAGFTYPVTHGFGCRNTVWNTKKLFLAGKSREYLASGLWGVRLMFTTESAGECVQIVERYLEMNDFEPASYTVGPYQERV